jgi:agmatine deiminase
MLAMASLVQAQTGQRLMLDEAAPHEGTWLQWPHQYTYGMSYRRSLDATWVAMTRALVYSEKVHIVAYNTTEKTRIISLLTAAGVSLTNVDFLIRRTNDVWVRDNGPLFVFDENHQLIIEDWGFNGWGYDTPYAQDDGVPGAVANQLKMPRVDLNDVVLEGGAIEVDGKGVLMATRSSILEPERNPEMTQTELEAVLTENLGVRKFIWLNGAPGGQEDITDMHIDGFARFGPNGTLVTLRSADLSYWGVSAADVRTLAGASDINGTPYRFVYLPLTANNVVTTSGYNIGSKGSYTNYYVANTVVLVSIYNDPNDAAALSIIQQLYPERAVIGIDVRNLYRWGGMVHCVTQQQPR